MDMEMDTLEKKTPITAHEGLTKEWQKRLRREHPIYLHCFDGNLDMYSEWKTHFSNIYVGFTKTMYVE